MLRAGHLRALYDVGVHSTVTRAQALSNARASSSSFTQFKSTVTVGGKSYTYVMAGENPAVHQSNPVSTIQAELVPVIVKALGFTWDPTKTDSCDAGATPLARTQQSPIFTSQSYTWGGTKVGTGQVTDVYQRADWWKYTQPGGINPGYAVNLSVKTLKPVTINVPNADASSYSGVCGNGHLADISINWLDSYLRKTVIPSLKSQGVGTTTLPIFLVHNVAEYTGTNPNNCCVLGYHNAEGSGGAVQTYAVADYDNTGAFTAKNIRDVDILSHELAEWQNDPYTNNPTPAWGHTGQDPNSCQSNLEVGDPLTSTGYTHVENGFTYHIQELAFFSWFYHQSPSLGVNGWYSDQGTFKSYAKACS
jgi:hypothetical protein